MPIGRSDSVTLAARHPKNERLHRPVAQHAVHALVAGLHYSGHARIEPMLFAVHHVAQNTFSYTTNNVLLEYDLSSGITMGSAATSSGWSASVSHSEMGTGEGCVVFYGNAATATVGSPPRSPKVR